MTAATPWQQVLGHDPQIEQLRCSVARGRLAHAYLFVGPEGIGKKRFAKALAQCLLCERIADAELDACGECSSCRQVQSETHPDFHSVGRLEGKSELTIDVFLGEKDRRGREGLCYELSHRPTFARRKIAIVDDADSMNAESANAFLKTLEETPADGIIILIAANENALLPTIRSRCQTVRFSPLATEHVAQLLVELAWLDDQQEAHRVAAMSQGSMHQAAQLLQPVLRDARDFLHAELSRESFRPLVLSQRMIETVDEVGGDTSEQRTTATWVVRFATEFYRMALLRCAGDRNDADGTTTSFLSTLTGDDRFDLELLDRLIELTLEAETHLQQRVGIPLCFEHLFDRLSHETRDALNCSPSRR